MTPKVAYDSANNAAYIRFSAKKVLVSAEVAPDIVLDYDADGHIVGMELLNARDQLPLDMLTEAA